MEQRLSVITLGVSDLARAIDFYANVVGWKKANGPDGVAFFDLNGIVFGLFPHVELAQDMKLSAQPLSSYRGITLAHNLRSKDEVDRLFAQLESFRFCLNRRFPNQLCSDSSFLLGTEASMDGASILTGSA